VTSGPPGGLQISNTSRPPHMSFKMLSILDRLRSVQPRYHIDIDGASRPIVSALAVVRVLQVSIPIADTIFRKRPENWLGSG